MCSAGFRRPARLAAGCARLAAWEGCVRGRAATHICRRSHSGSLIPTAAYTVRLVSCCLFSHVSAPPFPPAPHTLCRGPRVRGDVCRGGGRPEH